jgi:hypothetical protein
MSTRPAVAGATTVPSKGAVAVFQSVSSVPGDRSEKSTRRSARSADASHETLGRDRDGPEEEPALGADLGDARVIGHAVAREHEAVRAGVRAVQHAEPVRRWGARVT